jgi:hypothetical protein
VQRLQFVARATVVGWNWLVQVGNHVGVLLLVLLAIGVSVSAVTLPYWWMSVPILVGFAVVLFGEGAFRLWRKGQEEVGRQEIQLTAALVNRVQESTAGRRYETSSIEIVNSGSVTLTQVDWAFPTDARGWDYIGDVRRPWPELAKNERIVLPVVLSFGRDEEISLPVKALADGRVYEREIVVSAHSPSVLP